MDAIAAESQVDGTCHLHFLGYQADVPGFLKAVDFVLHPARNETFGRVLVEAAMMERAAVTTDCGGTREVVQDGVTGCLAPVDDVDALSRAVIQLAVHPDLRRRMGLAARRVAETFELGRFQHGMREALIDAHSRGPVLRYRAESATMRKLLQIPSIAMPALRALGIPKVVRLARRADR
jgi:glycosyltransferase involved in cell wall biosynthesis